MIKVSILVAVYNAEKFLGKCLRSLVDQTYKDIEIICIDDASTDRSVGIIEQMMITDDRIKLLKHDVNQGAAVARNTGLTACSGDVIGYLDADDWYDADTIEKLVNFFDVHEDADCVLYRCIYVDKDGRHRDYEGLTFDSMDGRTAFIESLTWNIHGIYAARKELYGQFQFDTTRLHFSDDNTTRLHYYKSRKVYQSDAPYYYRYNPDSTSNQISVMRMDYMAASQSMKQQMEALDCPEDIMRMYEWERMKILVDCYLFYYKYRNRFSKSDRSYCLAEMKNQWKGIEESRIDSENIRKLGYLPFCGHWTVFRLEEEIYFILKRISGKL